MSERGRFSTLPSLDNERVFDNLILIRLGVALTVGHVMLVLTMFLDVGGGWRKVTRAGRTVQVDGQYRIWYLDSVELDGIRGSWVFVSAGSKLLVDGY